MKKFKLIYFVILFCAILFMFGCVQKSKDSFPGKTETVITENEESDAENSPDISETQSGNPTEGDDQCPVIPWQEREV